MPKMNHRCGLRAETRLKVVLTDRPDERIRAVITNLSAGGAFIRLPPGTRPSGSLISLQFSLPEPAARQFELSALIVRECEDGIAVMFDEREEALAPAVSAARQSPRAAAGMFAARAGRPGQQLQQGERQ